MTALGFDPYPDEYRKIEEVYEWIVRTYENSYPMVGSDEAAVELLSSVFIGKFADIGIEVEINWDEARDPDTKAPIGMLIPEIIMCGRITPEEETDHDRVKWGVVRGLDGGQPGVVDPNTGEWKEEPKKKMIT